MVIVVELGESPLSGAVGWRILCSYRGSLDDLSVSLSRSKSPHQLEVCDPALGAPR